uniref:E3 ubiquitin-protein ligase RNF182 n=1 Tax=Knipowitschia caucasica TaxID=637954 RepID=A0AAV2LQR5_KNICA
MSCPPDESEDKESPPSEELECKICYQRYNVHSRKPKILDCLHRVCGRCLVKILDNADISGSVPCPFCRHQIEITEYEVSALPDDTNILFHLASRDRSTSSDLNKEVVLNPKSFSSSSPSQDSSNCLVITIMEVPRHSRSPSRNGSSEVYAEQSLDSLSIGKAEEKLSLLRQQKEESVLKEEKTQHYLEAVVSVAEHISLERNHLLHMASALEQEKQRFICKILNGTVRLGKLQKEVQVRLKSPLNIS